MSDSIEASTLGYCRWCGARVGADTFRDHESLQEYHLAASCQSCQDDMFLGVGGDPPVSHRVRHGVLIGAVCDDGDAPGDAHEVALVPFLFVVALKRLVWETRYVVWAGCGLWPSDPWVALEPMREAWNAMNIRVHCVPSCVNPILSDGLTGRDLVVGLDEAALRVASRLCPTVAPQVLVNLSAEIPSQQAFLGAHVPDDLGLADVRRGSALRQCAVLARVLSLPATPGCNVGCTPFELLLLSHAARFAESFGDICDGEA